MSARAEDIQKLRETTGAGVMDCKKALEDANGDFASAEALVRERGLLKAGKRAGRETGAGHVEAYVHAGRIGVLLELRAETDFVVRSEPFRELAHELVLQIAATASANVEALLAEPYIKDESRSVNDIVNEVIGKVGEKVAIGAFHRIEV